MVEKKIRNINESFTDEEFKYLEKMKKKLVAKSWRAAILAMAKAYDKSKGGAGK